MGEAPGETEENEGKPFVGASGRILTGLLQDAGINRDACFVGNVCQQRPPGNDISEFKWGDPVLKGLAQLSRDLEQYKPNLCLLLGGSAVHAFKTVDAYNYKKTQYPIGAWRGSLFKANAVLHGVKCLAAYHPAALIRVWQDTYITRYDFRRARKEGETPDLVLPVRHLEVAPTAEYILARLAQIKLEKPLLTFDIEGSPRNIYCLSIALSHADCFIIPFTTTKGESVWDVETEATIWKALASVLSDATIPKVLQNGLYDIFVFTYFGILVRGVVDDTMLLHWEHMCEMEKSLSFQCSFYTREPNYKQSVRSKDDDKDLDYWQRVAKLDDKTFFHYCCMDSAITRECRDVLRKTVTLPSSLSHYNFNLSLLKPMLYMEMRGIQIDHEKKTLRILELQEEAAKRQSELDQVVGHPINVRSTKQVPAFLYDELKLPPPSGRYKSPRAGDYETVLKLAKRTGHPALMPLIRLREVLKRISDLESLGTDSDGRVRFSYNVVGSVTGRVSCSKSSTGAGCNGQTICDANPIFQSDAMRAGFRDLFIADPDNYFFQCDLSGADGWTVAAHCARLGDPTMLDDLLFGLKIPKVIALIVRYGPSINRLDRAALKARTEEIKKDDHLYFSCKQVQHGTNYGMKPPTVALRVFLESYGEVNISNTDAETYQSSYLSRYRGILRWHDWIREQIRKGYLISATGQKRIVTGRKESDDTWKEMLSHEPQANTTYATNLAALNLWRSVPNRCDRQLRIEPLHQVHDALCGQFPFSIASWAVEQIQSYFNNTLTIAGIPIKIPFDGRYGSSWGNLEAGKI